MKQLFVVTGLLLITAVAYGESKALDYCARDAKRLCTDVEPGNGRIIRCLVSVWDDLSEECQTVMNKVEKAVTPAVKQKKNKQQKLGAVEACKNDIEKFCQGRAELHLAVDCLRNHLKELEKACRQEVEEGLRKLREFISICGADAVLYCPGVEQRQGPILKCLARHRDEIAEECRSLIDNFEAKLKRYKEACKPDMARLCPNVPATGGALLLCMGQHRSEASVECQEALDQVEDWTD